MNEKTARANVLLARSLLRSRIRFPKVTFRELLASEDLTSVVKEMLGQYIQKRISRRS